MDNENNYYETESENDESDEGYIFRHLRQPDFNVRIFRCGVNSVGCGVVLFGGKNWQSVNGDEWCVNGAISIDLEEGTVHRRARWEAGSTL